MINGTTISATLSGDTYTFATISGKTLSVRYAKVGASGDGNDKTYQGHASLVTPSKVTCSGTITLTATCNTSGPTLYLYYGTALPTATSGTSPTLITNYTKLSSATITSSNKGTVTLSGTLSGSYYLIAAWEAGSSTSTISCTITGLQY